MKRGAHSFGVPVSDRLPVSFGSRGWVSGPSFGTREGQFRGAGGGGLRYVAGDYYSTT